MSLLIVEHEGTRTAAAIRGRLLIGRRAGNGLVIRDDGVSRLHAWIDLADGACFIADTRSRTGTLVNERHITGKHRLSHGDTIRIGSARIVYHEADEPPADIPWRTSEAPAVKDDPGILFDCPCGAPLWVRPDRAGEMGQCHHCGQSLRIPTASGKTAARAVSGLAAPAARKNVCAICQTHLLAADLTVACPGCGLVFHADCWQDNRGCAAYGCPRVGCLDSAAAPASDGSGASVSGRSGAPASIGSGASALGGSGTPALGGSGAPTRPRPMVDLGPDSPATMAGSTFPWDHAIAALAVLASVAGVLLYGVPAIFVFTIATARRLLSTAPTDAPPAWTAIVISALGTLVGLTASYLWHNGWRGFF